MNLTTQSLKIIPLNLKQFSYLLKGIDRMEKELGLIVSNENLNKEMQIAMEGLYEEALKHPCNYLWYTNWQIILKSENKSIGSACFMKEPDEDGIVEVGYEISLEYRNNGYATEAIRALCNWALSLPSSESYNGRNR